MKLRDRFVKHIVNWLFVNVASTDYQCEVYNQINAGKKALVNDSIEPEWKIIKKV